MLQSALQRTEQPPGPQHWTTRPRPGAGSGHTAASRSAARSPAAHPRAANPLSSEDGGGTPCGQPALGLSSTARLPSHGFPGASFLSETSSSSTRN